MLKADTFDSQINQQPNPLSIFCIIISCLKLEPHRQETCASCRENFYNYVLTSYISLIGLHKLIGELVRKLAQSLMPV